MSECYSYEPAGPYELMIGPLGDDPTRCPMVHPVWNFGRCHFGIQSAVELICKTCGRLTVVMCNGCLQSCIDYVAEHKMGCADQTPSHAVVAIESIVVIPCPP
jgi:hypothetical protein